MESHEITTPDGSEILVADDGDGETVWIGCMGRFTADDLRDIADALDACDVESLEDGDEDDEEE